MSNLQASSLFDLSSKTALVTGGGTGIGLNAALALASNGATVYISGRRKEKLDDAVKHYNPTLPTEKGEKLIAVQGDVSSKEDLAKIASHIKNEAGKLHILINNAGIEGPMTKFSPDSVASLTAEEISKAHLESESFDEWDKLFRINSSSIFFSTMTFLPLLHASHTPTWTSAVINITSISGIVKLSQFHYAYNASKAAANHLTVMLSHELKFRSNLGVRVNAIAPGLFSSEMTGGGKSSNGKTDPEDVKGHANPAGRVGSEEEYAQLVLLLANNGFMTGQVVAVDGGFVSAVAATR